MHFLDTLGDLCKFNWLKFCQFVLPLSWHLFEETGTVYYQPVVYLEIFFIFLLNFLECINWMVPFIRFCSFLGLTVGYRHIGAVWSDVFPSIYIMGWGMNLEGSLLLVPGYDLENHSLFPLSPLHSFCAKVRLCVLTYFTLFCVFIPSRSVSIQLTEYFSISYHLLPLLFVCVNDNEVPSLPILGNSVVY